MWSIAYILRNQWPLCMSKHFLVPFFPVAPSYKTRNLTDKIITKEDTNIDSKHKPQHTTNVWQLKYKTGQFGQITKPTNQTWNIYTFNNQWDMWQIWWNRSTNHLFLECEMYSEKIWQILQQLIVKAQRRPSGK